MHPSFYTRSFSNWFHRLVPSFRVAHSKPIMAETTIAESSKRSRSPSPKGVDEPPSKKQAVDEVSTTAPPSASAAIAKDDSDVATRSKDDEESAMSAQPPIKASRADRPGNRAWDTNRKGKGKWEIPEWKKRDDSAKPKKEGGEGGEGEGVDGEGKKRLPKKKAAILLG